MKLTVDVPSEVEELLDEKCKKTQKEPSELVELLLEWYFLKRKKPQIDEIGNANDFLKIADYCAKERLYNCKYSDVENCNRDVKVQASKKPKPLHPYMCLFCSHFEDQREQNKTEQEEQQEESKTQNPIDEQRIAKIAAGIIMEQYGKKLEKDTDSGSEDANSKELSLNQFEEEIDEEPEEELITRDKVEKLLKDW